MLFNSEVFLLFAFIFFPLYFFAPGLKFQHSITLVASYVFYGWWDWRFLFLIGFCTIFNFYITQRLASKRGKSWLVFSIVVNLGILGIFKYYNFFIDQLITMIESFGVNAHHSTLSIILPVGISFFTFQTMSYVIDVWRGKLQLQGSLLNFAVYVSLFPQLVAGPIVRASDLLPQLEVLHRFKWTNFWIGMEKVILGLVLKIVIADRLAPFVERTFDYPSTFDGLGLMIGVFFFAVQIYGDFAGYSLIAIGLGKIMGLDFPVNFRRPYMAVNFSDFWRRWHISLSSWLRDYLYISLGGNRGGKFKTNRNLMLTMVLGGLWHGAGWPFMVWGVLHGGYLVLQRLFWPFQAKGFFSIWLSRILVFSLVCFAWVFFRADSFQSAISIIKGIVFADSYSFGELRNKFQLIIAFGLALSLLILEVFYEDSYKFRRFTRCRNVRAGFAAFLLFTLPFLGTFTGGSFVYFQF
ncbi:MAG: membrane-bound O-acyltransferase family protein [Robiginitomaculum sp.]|nr:MAG: membrane-bound O-acyltransferase family protein [Robiginitomaculum sp.]